MEQTSECTVTVTVSDEIAARIQYADTVLHGINKALEHADMRIREDIHDSKEKVERMLRGSITG